MLYHNNAGSSVYVTQILLFFQPLFAFQVEKELYFKVTRTGIKKFLFFLKNHTQSLYKQLIDIYAIDSGEKLNRFEICYNLLSLEWNNRANVTVTVSDKQLIESVTDLYPNALWYERETYDMFGIIFFW